MIKVNEVVKKLIVNSLMEAAPMFVDSLKSVLKSSFSELAETTFVEGSHFNLINYKVLFNECVDKFNFLTLSENKISFTVPSMDSFDFSKLGVVKAVFEGLAGNYLEMSSDDYISMAPTSVISSNDFYLIRKTPELVNYFNNVLHKPVVNFPLSNLPPLQDKVFGQVKQRIKVELATLVSDCVRSSLRKSIQTFSGVAYGTNN